jgi:glycosyltransferase involved in cell wall biosynthesis
VRVAVVSWLAGKLYRQADGVVAICNEMRSEISTVRKISLDQIQVIYNPILISEIRRKGNESSGHEWCDKATAPIVLAVGRLQRQKDFATLLRAFQLVRLRQNAKLILVGEGEQREFLEKLARDLNIQEDVDMPGFSANPYAYMARASVYVLSSLFEGLPNALLEALAIGVPIVSTDCKTGPGEILRGGLDGHLVPVQDHVTMARVIEECLRSPNRGLPSKESLERFELRSVTSQYLKLLLPDESFT